jgi:hypothetical protein
MAYGFIALPIMFHHTLCRWFTAIFFRDAADDRDSSEITPRRWCLQTEISASVIRSGRRKSPHWLGLGGTKQVEEHVMARRKSLPPILAVLTLFVSFATNQKSFVHGKKSTNSNQTGFHQRFFASRGNELA